VTRRRTWNPPPLWDTLLGLVVIVGPYVLLLLWIAAYLGLI
jgi:hypothetical protein